MILYLPDNYRFSRYVLANIAELIFFLCFLFLVRVFLSQDSFSIITVILYTLFFAVRFYWNERITKVAFDNNKKELIVNYTHLGNKNEEIFPFNELNIKITRKRDSSIRILTEPISITIYKGIIEYYDINNTKDGFSIESLENIVEQFKSHSLPVTEEFL